LIVFVVLLFLILISGTLALINLNRLIK
jgi:hypothetical protein